MSLERHRTRPGTYASYIVVQNYKKNGKRIRPYETVKPIAEKLHLDIDHSCDRDDAGCAADKIHKASKNGAKRILVCWEHKRLSDIADKLGVDGLGTYEGVCARLEGKV